MQSLNVQCIASKSRLMCLAQCAAQQELTTATYLTAMKPATVGDTAQHYRGKKNEIRTFISLPKNVLERQRKEIFGVKTRPLARDGLCTEEMAVCGQLGTGG